MKLMPKRFGFTLIELLIVISIIAILVLIGLATYSLFLKSARDAKRQSDLKFIQSALQEYHGDQKFYPLSGGSCTSYGSLAIDCPLKDPGGNKTYLNKIPKDPSFNGPQYLYEAKVGSSTSCDNTLVNCNNYCLWTRLENNPQSVQLSANCPTFPAGGYNFLVTPP